MFNTVLEVIRLQAERAVSAATLASPQAFNKASTRNNSRETLRLAPGTAPVELAFFHTAPPVNNRRTTKVKLHNV